MKTVVAIKLKKDKHFQDAETDGLLELESGTVLKISGIHARPLKGDISVKEALELVKDGDATPLYAGYESDDAEPDVAEEPLPDTEPVAEEPVSE